MGMGIVSDADFEKELNNSTRTNRHVHQPEVIQENIPGRKPGDRNVPESLRKVIADEVIMNGRAEALQMARAFDISPSSVSAYTRGANTTDAVKGSNKGLSQYLRARKNRVTKKALRTLVSAIDTITPEKLAAVKAKDAASIAKDMSVVVKNMEPPTEQSNTDSSAPKFIFYAPSFVKEEHYETIHVNE